MVEQPYPTLTAPVGVRERDFLHDVGQRAGCVLRHPGDAQGQLRLSLRHSDPDREPGVVGLEVEAGDAIFFTEALRHGGLTNRSTQVRKTLHVGYGPHFMMWQNITLAPWPCCRRCWMRFTAFQPDTALRADVPHQLVEAYAWL